MPPARWEGCWCVRQRDAVTMLCCRLTVPLQYDGTDLLLTLALGARASFASQAYSLLGDLELLGKSGLGGACYWCTLVG